MTRSPQAWPQAGGAPRLSNTPEQRPSSLTAQANSGAARAALPIAQPHTKIMVDDREKWLQQNHWRRTHPTAPWA